MIDTGVYCQVCRCYSHHRCWLVCLMAESTVFANLFVIRLRRGASENLFCAVSIRARPRLLYASVSREKGGGRRRWYRGSHTFLGNVGGDRFVTLGYCVRAVLRSNSRPDLSQAVLVLVGAKRAKPCLLYTSPSPRDRTRSRMPSSA